LFSIANWKWEGIKHTFVKFNQLPVPSGHLVYLAGDNDRTSSYGAACDGVQGIQMGETDTDNRVLGEYFHPDHRLETISPRYPMSYSYPWFK
jgi:hypothetical protein